MLLDPMEQFLTHRLATLNLLPMKYPTVVTTRSLLSSKKVLYPIFLINSVVSSAISAGQLFVILSQIHCFRNQLVLERYSMDKKAG
jgi:hypothetical protein